MKITLMYKSLPFVGDSRVGSRNVERGKHKPKYDPEILKRGGLTVQKRFNYK